MDSDSETQALPKLSASTSSTVAHSLLYFGNDGHNFARRIGPWPRWSAPVLFPRPTAARAANKLLGPRPSRNVRKPSRASTRRWAATWQPPLHVGGVGPRDCHVDDWTRYERPRN